MRREVKILLGIAALAGGALWVGSFSPVERFNGPLRSEAYVWQRRWGPELVEAVVHGASRFSSLVVLDVEVSLDGNRRRVAHACVDYGLLADLPVPTGLALRVGPYPGPFGRTDEPTRWLAGLARDTVDRARASGLEPAELQIDFDCAASKLEGYLVWVEEIRNAVQPIPLTITVLPSWMGHSGFRRLVEAVPRYVLQVHSLERPEGPQDSLVLCDPGSSARWVEQAARYGVPFRVALPTYGYVVAFDADGRFEGLHAEGGVPHGSRGTMLRETRANPDELAALIRQWTADRPALLEGMIWYRLPVGTDDLNWSWQTLSAVLEGRSPRASVRAVSRRVEAGLYEIVVHNEGERDLPLLPVEIRWSGARLVAGEAFGESEWVDAGADKVVFQTVGESRGPRVVPGESLLLGWLRMSGEVEIHVEMLADDTW
jgi:hypothetical protein